MTRLFGKMQGSPITTRPARALVLLLLVGLLQACPLEFWTFSSLDQCGFVSENVDKEQPLSKGTIFADGTCRTTQVLESSLEPPGFQLPGTYSAFCVASTSGISSNFGVVEMWESGCLDASCGRNLDSSPPNTCDRDMTSPSSLYSRLSPPGELIVQNPNLRRTGYFRCDQFDGQNGLSVAFAVFGDCNCNRPTMAPTAVPTVEPTMGPTVERTTEPTSAPSTTAPTEATTEDVVEPTTTATTEATTSGVDPGTTTGTGATSGTGATTVPPPTVSQEPPNSEVPPVTTPSQPSNPGLRPTDAPTQTPGTNVSASAESSKKSEGSSNFLPMIAGGAVAGAVFVAIAVAAVWYFSKQKQKAANSPKDHKSYGDGTPLPASFSTQSPPPGPLANHPADNNDYPEIVCSPSDDISTLGEPIGMDWQNQMKSDDSTASVSISYIRNMLLQGGGGGFARSSVSDVASRTEASSTAMTEIDPDKFMPADDDEESFENVFHKAFTPSKKDNVMRFVINVPPGRLGMLLDGTDGIPTVNQIKPDSVFACQNVKVGDHLVAVDAIDVRGMEAIDVSQLIVMKARQPRRVFIFERIKPAGHAPDDDEDVQV